MQLAVVDRGMETNVSASSSFGIANVAKMFKIITNQIYSDKALAICRELYANALDTHARFRVALPSPTEPMLQIRDFGPGLDSDFMLTKYTLVGFSTKDASNDEVGGFGWGRLAPFAYTDAYTVTSYQRGQKSVYAVFRSSDDIPAISHISTEPTDEPDGLEVKVPIQAGDYDKFRAATQKVLMWFPPVYEVFGARIDPAAISVRSDDWLVTTRGSSHRVLMGPISYALDWSQVGVDPLPLSIMPVFKIGELDLSPSRETLSYDRNTIAKLKARHAQIIRQLPPLVLKRARSLDPVGRVKLVKELNDAGFFGMFDAYHKAVGNRDRDRIRREVHAAWHGLYADHKPRKRWGTFLLDKDERITIPGPITKYGESRRGAWDRGEARSAYHFTEHSIADLARTTFVVDDVNGHRVRDRITNNLRADRGVLVLKSPPPYDLPYQLLSDLEPPAPKGKSEYVRVYRWRDDGYDEDFLSSSSGGLYVRYNSDKLDEPRGLLRTGWAQQETVWGLTETALRRLGRKKFRPLQDYLLEKAQAALADPAVIRALSADQTMEAARKSPLFGFVHARASLGHTNLLSDVTERMRQLQADRHEAVPNLRSLAVLKLIELPKPEDHHGVLPALKKAEKRNTALLYFLSKSPNIRHGNEDAQLARFCK